ncbi:hypothetical protein [Leptolyngbya sp. GGD]|uniref:hypothetical protein n=1 Tax=Leptolyngbya sp. GGD TaxID=2997907 RepID=UPI00227BFB33|nr:hypothetical protein [Leptolyngbya sp. GGD]MCY6494537.1 hypothetical protein [Leptolyngbya sp. GGD]
MYIRSEYIEEAKIDQIQELRPEQWQKLNTSDRCAVLQKCADAIAEFEGRPKDVIVAEMYFFDSKTKGEFHPKDETLKTNTILISHEVLKCDDPYIAFGVLVHESRHAYICHAMDTPGFHPGQEQDIWLKDRQNAHAKSPGRASSEIEKYCDLAQKSLVDRLKKEVHPQQRSKEQLAILLYLCQEKQAALEIQAQKQKDEKERDR